MIKQDPEPIDINVSVEKVCFIIVKAREYDVKVEPHEESDPGSNPSDDADSEVLEDYASDPTLAELRETIMDLNDDEVVDVIAIAWVGRGDFDRSDFQAARDLAMERHRPNSAPYLIGIPTLGDLLEEGLAELGYSCEDTDSAHL